MGILLVTSTWLLSLLLLISLGALPSYLLIRRPSIVGPQGNPQDLSFTWIRISMWSGLATLTALVLTWSLFGGLGSLVVGWLLVIVAVLSATGAISFQRSSGCLASPMTIAKSFRRSDWLIALAALLIMAVLATTALGPVTHYDAGLYQLGAIVGDRAKCRRR